MYEPATPDVSAASLVDPVGEVFDVNESMWTYLVQEHPLFTIVCIVIPSIISALLFIFILAVTNGLSGDLFMLAFFPLLLPIGAYRFVRTKYEKAFFVQIANQLHLKYSAWGDNPTSGQLFKLGDYSRASNQLSGEYKGLAMRLFDYTFTIGRGRAQTSYQYAVAELTVDGLLPELMIQPRSVFSFLSELNGWQPPGTIELPLGGFDEKFVTYVAEGYEMESLQILEPTVMLALMEGFESFGIEFNRNHVYIFRQGLLEKNRDTITSFITLLGRLYSSLIPELENVTKAQPVNFIGPLHEVKVSSPS